MCALRIMCLNLQYVGQIHQDACGRSSYKVLCVCACVHVDVSVYSLEYSYKVGNFTNSCTISDSILVSLSNLPVTNSSLLLRNGYFLLLEPSRDSF